MPRPPPEQAPLRYDGAPLLAMIGAQQAADAKAKAEEKERKEAELAQVVAPPCPSSTDGPSSPAHATAHRLILHPHPRHLHVLLLHARHNPRRPIRALTAP